MEKWYKMQKKLDDWNFTDSDESSDTEANVIEAESTLTSYLYNVNESPLLVHWI